MQETVQKVKKSNGNLFPFPWTQRLRQNMRPVLSQTETLKNMNFMTEVDLFRVILEILFY